MKKERESTRESAQRHAVKVQEQHRLSIGPNVQQCKYQKNDCQSRKKANLDSPHLNHITPSNGETVFGGPREGATKKVCSWSIFRPRKTCKCLSRPRVMHPNALVSYREIACICKVYGTPRTASEAQTIVDPFQDRVYTGPSSVYTTVSVIPNQPFFVAYERVKAYQYDKRPTSSSRNDLSSHSSSSISSTLFLDRHSWL
jgi:hypothetical protein